MGSGERNIGFSWLIVDIFNAYNWLNVELAERNSCVSPVCRLYVLFRNFKIGWDVGMFFLQQLAEQPHLFSGLSRGHSALRVSAWTRICRPVLASVSGPIRTLDGTASCHCSKQALAIEPFGARWASPSSIPCLTHSTPVHNSSQAS